jgi:hypothetical protein
MRPCMSHTVGVSAVIKLSCWLHLEQLFEAITRGIVQHVTCIALETGHLTSLFQHKRKVTLCGHDDRSLLGGSPESLC